MVLKDQKPRVSTGRPLLGKAHGQEWESREALCPRGYILAGHVGECLRMARMLFDNPSTPFGPRLFEVMGLERYTTYPEFRAMVVVAVLCHDLGKAGDEFQEMIYRIDDETKTRAKREVKQLADKTFKPGRRRTSKRYRQTFRHEFLSGWLMQTHPVIQKWLEEATGSKAGALHATAGATGHHRKKPSVEPDNAPAYQIRLRDLSQDLAKLSHKYGLPPFPVIDDIAVTSQELRRFCARKPGPDSPLTQAVRWATIICDSLGSITWSKSAYRKTFLRGLSGFIGRIYRPLDVDHYTENHPSLWELQREILNFKGLDLLLEEFCGGGKSTLSCLWAPRDRYYVCCSPTTGLATEQYVGMSASRGEGPQMDALYHSRRFAAMADLATCESADDRESDDSTLPELDPDLIEEFARFGHERTFVTVDQVLGLMVNAHKSVLWLLHLVRGAIVFDEVHAYDAKMCGTLIQFMRTFPGLPVLLMSATISKAHRRHLTPARNFTHIYGYRPDAGARLPRYRIHVVSEDEAAEVAMRAGKTLWAVNRVPEAQRLARLRPEALIYHAQFRFCDRETRHKQFIDAFNGDLDFLAIATQVTEMGLDISASTLISEIASIAALIQRLGRLNRRSTGDIGHAYFYMPNKPHPYDPVELAAAMAWLKSLEGRDLSALDLNESFRDLDLRFVPQPLGYADNLLWTSTTTLRELEHSALAFWQTDLDAIPALRYDRRLIRKHEVQMFVPPNVRGRLLYDNYHYILPPDAYDLRLGGLQEKL